VNHSAAIRRSDATIKLMAVKNVWLPSWARRSMVTA